MMCHTTPPLQGHDAMALDRPKPVDQIGLGVGAVEGLTQMKSDYPGHAPQPLERSKTDVAAGRREISNLQNDYLNIILFSSCPGDGYNDKLCCPIPCQSHRKITTCIPC